jgi:hypothetical protein
MVSHTPSSSSLQVLQTETIMSSLIPPIKLSSKVLTVLLKKRKLLILPTGLFKTFSCCHGWLDTYQVGLRYLRYGFR